jgi:hypothetical protein
MNEETCAHREWHYQAFVLRLWATEDAETDTRIWRFSLEDTRTGVRRGFATLEALVAFLVAQMQ